MIMIERTAQKNSEERLVGLWHPRRGGANSGLNVSANAAVQDSNQI